MSDPATHGGSPVERIDTHSAAVFLAGDRAYKLKRAVWFPFLDFSTLERRHAAAEAELRLNRRTAPEIYQAVLPVTREADGRLALAGAGEPLDWVVAMRRFDQAGLFDRMAVEGRLDRDLTLALADSVAAFHAAAERSAERGGAAIMRWVIRDNAEELAPCGDAAATLLRQSLAALDRVAPLLDARRAAGFVRRCHGDLHLRNICLIDGRPALFDAIEFNDDLSCIDVLYDLAFLLMDLIHRGRRDLANMVLNRYLARTGDIGGLPALPLFLSVRAAVRAKVMRAAASQAQAGAGPLTAEADRYLDLARECLMPAPLRLVAVGGEPGAGKSTLAERLAPLLGGALGAVVLRSDVIRKQMFDRDILSRLPEAAYSDEASRHVFGRLCQEGQQVLDAGFPLVADATFAARGDRADIALVAAAAGVPFTGFWLEAPMPLRTERVAARRRDPSDATVDLLPRFRADPPDESGWHRLDAASGASAVADSARAILGGPLLSQG
ncbi:MAG: AAA family ATPase [Alphaproteobacteria bacterium]